MAIVAIQDPPLVADIEHAEEPMPTTVRLLKPGTRVEVKRRFDAKWSRGFEVLEHEDDCYRLRRLSDGATLPVLFAADDVRTERRNNTWWI